MANSISRNQIVDLHHLFGAPLMATVDADIMAAEKFVKFIETYGFAKENGTSKTSAEKNEIPYGKLRMVEFSYDQTDYDLKQQKDATKNISVKIPLLSMLPLPSLQITEAEFEFDVRLVDFEHKPPKKSAPALLTNNEHDMAKPLPSTDAKNLRVRASIAPRTPDKLESAARNSITSNMKVKINMKQADMPAGISTLLKIMHDSIQTTETSNE